jgi:SSS family solute:Na+ symporter
MAASGAKYGMMTSHFYWVGAIPAMVFVGIFMMPFYYGSRARSVPEYLKLRFDEKTRGFNALTFAAMTVFSSGISMYALAKLLELHPGWNFHAACCCRRPSCWSTSFWAASPRRSTTRCCSSSSSCRLPAARVCSACKDVGGWAGLTANLEAGGQSEGLRRGRLHAVVAHLGDADGQPDGRRVVRAGGMGLGFVLSFGYWCTDFLVVQRAMAANSMTPPAARR